MYNCFGYGMDYPQIAICLILTALITYFVYWCGRWLIGLQKVDEIDKKYVFVTGCDSGFGEELCIELDRLGCHVFAGCLTVDGMMNIKNRCSNNVFPVILDVCDHASVLKCLEDIKKQLPVNKGLWGLVNNAGICGTIGPMQWLNVNDFKEVIHVNFLGAIDVTLSTLPLLRSENKHESVRIVNMTSVLAHFIVPCALPYCLSKSSLVIFSDCLRMELKNSNITVSTIRPGAHKSNFTETGLLSLKQTWERMSLKQQNIYGEDYYKRISMLERLFMSVFARENHKEVIDAYVHALFSRRPYHNYSIGYDAFVMTFLSYLPNFILIIIYSILGILPHPTKE